MPVGAYPKDEIRRHGRRRGLPQRPQARQPGDLLHTPGRLPQLRPAARYPQAGATHQQRGRVRSGLTRASSSTPSDSDAASASPPPDPLYVIAIDPDSGDITIGPESELYRDDLWAEGVNYILGEPPSPGVRISVKIRYKSTQSAARLYHHGPNALLRFDEPQRAVTPGQAVVFYRDDEVLGGGRISHPPKQDFRIPVGALSEASASADAATPTLDGGFGANALP